VFELGSVICGAAQSSAMLIVGRAVAGMGGSGLINGALTILSAAVTLEKRPRTSSYLLLNIYRGLILQTSTDRNAHGM
jgi:MFS family permease